MPKSRKKKVQNYTVEYGLFAWIAAISFFTLVFFSSSFKVMGDDDFFWHLATGRYIAENQVVPDKDVFGFVTQGTQWIPFEWGWDVISYFAYLTGGYNAILILKSLIFVLFFLIYFLLLRRFSVHPFISLLLLFILLMGMFDRLSPRPHVFTYLFFVILLYILLSYKYLSRQKYQKKLYFIPIIFLFWCNIHMGVLAGGLFLFLFTISEVLTYSFNKKGGDSTQNQSSIARLKILLLISVISFVVLIINPHGVSTYIYAYNHTKLKMLESIGEWQNPFTGKLDMTFSITVYKILLFSGILLIFYSIAKKDILIFMTAVVFTYYSVRAVRFTVDYEIITAVFLAVSIMYFIKNNLLKALNNKILLKILFSISIIFFCYLTYLTYTNKLYSIVNYYRVNGWGIDEVYMPVQLFDFMKENNITGNPFNHFETGGYLIWNFPGQKNFIDSRNLTDKIFNEYNTILYRKYGFEDKIKEYDFDYILYFNPEIPVRANDMKNHITGYAGMSSYWKLVYWDDKSMLFLSDKPKYSGLIDKYHYRILNPITAFFYRSDFMENVKKDSLTTEKEIERKLNSEPNGTIFRTIYPVALSYLNKK